MITHIFDFRFIYLPHCGLWLSLLVLCSETVRRLSRLLLRPIKRWIKRNRFSLSFGWIASLTGFKETFLLNCCLVCSKEHRENPLVYSFIISVKRFKDLKNVLSCDFAETSQRREAMKGDCVRRLPQRRVGFVGQEFEGVRRGVKTPLSWLTALVI